MFADNSLWEGLSYTCQLGETVKWSGVIKFLTPINLIEPHFEERLASLNGCFFIQGMTRIPFIMPAHQ